MDRKLEILLVEDDQNDCKEIINAVDDDPNEFVIIGITNNSTRALQYVMDAKPDAVILDLELHNGGGDGLDFLKRLQGVHLKLIPFILVTTNNISSVTHDIARELGADYIMTKNQQDYSGGKVLEFLKIAKSVILKRRSQSDAQNEDESPTQSAKRIQRRICAELNAVGISQKSMGYQYLIDAICITVNEPVTRICSVIGEMHRKTENSVERAMQNAIDRTWKTTDINVLLQHYTAKINPDRGAPTITEFIHYYAQQIKNDY